MVLNASSSESREGNSDSELIQEQKNSDCPIHATPQEEIPCERLLRTKKTTATVSLTFRLFVEARVILMSNRDVQEGLINGARMTAKRFLWLHDQVMTVLVDFDRFHSNPVAINRTLMHQHEIFDRKKFQIFNSLFASHEE
jgi:hypothetical protein